MSLEEVLALTYFENSLKAYLFFTLILFLGIVFKRLIVRYLGGMLYRILGKSANELGRTAFDDRLRKPLNNLISLGVLFMAAQQLQFSC